MLFDRVCCCRDWLSCNWIAQHQRTLFGNDGQRIGPMVIDQMTNTVEYPIFSPNLCGNKAKLMIAIAKTAKYLPLPLGQ